MGSTDYDSFLGYDSDPADTSLQGIYYLTGILNVYMTSIATVGALETQATYTGGVAAHRLDFTTPYWKMSATGLPYRSPVLNWVCSSSLPTGITCQ